MTNLEVLKELNEMVEDCCFTGDGPNWVGTIFARRNETTTRCLASKSDELAQRVYNLSSKLGE